MVIFSYQHAASLDFSNRFGSSVHTTSNSKPFMDSESPTTCKDLEAHSRSLSHQLTQTSETRDSSGQCGFNRAALLN